MQRLLFPCLLVLAACGPAIPEDDGGTGGGESDAGPQNCQAPYRSCQVTFRFRAIDEQSVQLRGNFAPNGWNEGVPMKREGDEWVATVAAAWGAPVEYKFLINNALWVNDPANDATANGNSLRAGETCEVFTCEAGAPEDGSFDWRDAVMAFVFVDRFFNADTGNDCHVPGADPAGQYQGGDWKGVTQKINEGYFTQLGVNALWLTVPLKNPTVAGGGTDGRQYSGFHGYWPVSFTEYESCFGTKEELMELVNAAHGQGIQVLYDFAMVHVHDSSPLYAAHPDWFWPLDFQGGQCTCGSGVCDWNAQGHRCWFTDYLPHWNYTVDAAREYSVDQAVALLADTGADGFRLDAIKHVDDSWLLLLRQKTEALAATRSPRPRMYFVGETYDFGNRDYLKSFVDPKTKLDGQFDFPLRLELLEAVVTRRSTMTALRNFVDSNDNYYGPRALMSPWLGNHDLGRVIHMAEDVPLWDNPYHDGKDVAFDNRPGSPDYRAPYERIANGFVFLLTSPGVPLLYYGDEVGLPGGGDPDNRRFMQWEGYSSHQAWLKERVEKLGQLRRDNAALRRGTRTSLYDNDDVYVYSMSDGTQTLYIAINRGDSEATAPQFPARALEDLYTGSSVTGPSVTLPPRSARIMR